MKLSKVVIHNYRCYSENVAIKIDDLTCVIGRNDVGKSSILEALDAFFNDNNISNSDLYIAAPSDDKKIEITCFFTDLPQEMILDSKAPCNLDEEGLLNRNKELEVKRVWDFSGKTVSKSVFLHSNYYDAIEAEDLLSKKNASLKSFIRDNQIGMLSGGKVTINRDIRRAIRTHYNMNARHETYIKVDGGLETDDNIKNIWKVISSQLPVFALFKMDRLLNDKDGNVQDPMKLAIEEALKVDEIQQKLREIEEHVKEHTTQIADATIKKLSNFDSKLAERLQSSFSKECKWSNVFDISLVNENKIPLNKRGSGIRRLVLLSFFQAQAESKKQERNSPAIIYAIEEPETSQHPEHQIEIIHSLVQLANQISTQVIFTTHSSNLVSEIPIASIRYVVAGSSVEIKIPILENGDHDEQILSDIIQQLGILPSPRDKIKVLLYVEGNNDVSALKGYSKILFDNKLIDEDIMSSTKVGIVIAGGSSLRYYIDNKYLEGLGKPEVHIYDNDKLEYQKCVEQINRKNDPNIKAYNTSMREMENFLCKEAIIESYEENGTSIDLPDINSETDVPIMVCEALNRDWNSFDVGKKKKKESKVKQMLNSQSVNKMTKNRLETRGVISELKSWFDKIIEFSSL